MKNLPYNMFRKKRVFLLLCMLSLISYTIHAQVSPQERQALIDFYNATGGDNWTNTVAGNQPWMINDPTSLVSDWFGVFVSDGKVIRILLDRNNIGGEIPTTIGNLSNLLLFSLTRNQLTGSIPPELGSLSNLTQLFLNNNQLTGSIPSKLGNLSSLTGLSLYSNQLTGSIPSGFTALALSDTFNTFTLDNNSFVFNDFETEFLTYKNEITAFNYLVQDKVDQKETISVTEKGSITLTSNALTSANNTYQWYKDNVVIDGATNKDLVISNASDTDVGVYHFVARNSIITDLVLTRNPITLEVTPDEPNEGCDILEGIVDGSFEDCSLDAFPVNQKRYNNEINCSNWEKMDTGISPSTWLVDSSDQEEGDLIISTNVSASPDGGVFASSNVTHGRVFETLSLTSATGINDDVKTGGFKTIISNLEIGNKYTVIFYQSQGGSIDLSGNPVPLSSSIDARWVVSFGTEIKNSNSIPIKSISNISAAPIWEKVELTFTPNATQQELSFSSYGSTDKIVEKTFFYNLLIDGIKVIKDGGCNDIPVEVQKFCALNEDITIGDLQSPFPFSTVSWYSTELNVASIATGYVIPESAIYWAASNEDPSLSRIPVHIVLDAEIPTGTAIQTFEESDVPTLDDIQVAGAGDLQWYPSVNGEIPLANGTQLTHNTYYYAALGGSKCRLRVLVRINGLIITGCNILDEYVDGSFENCQTVASTYGHNDNVTCGEWINGKGTADTWKIPFQVIHHGIVSDIQPSPDGGVIAGGIARTGNSNESESFYTDLKDLTIGETYEIEFYQSNVTGNFDPNIEREEARWKVNFGDQVQYSTYMVVNKNPVWQKSTLKFVASSNVIKLEFTASSANKTESVPYVYMMIDGIKLSQLTGGDAACPDDIIYELQNFCSVINDLTVGDLLGPDGVTDAIWFSKQIGGYRFAVDDLLLKGGVGIPYTDVYWAESSQFIGRKPVRVIIDEGIPGGNTLQVFNLLDSPTVADLEVFGNNVQWYASPTSQFVLQDNVVLIDGYTYYAGHNGMECRLAVEVEVAIDIPIVEQTQVLCATDEPTVDDLIADPSDPSYVISWYDSLTSDTPLSGDTPIENSRVYFVSQDIGNGLISERISVYVILLSVDPPTGASVQTIYTNETATVRNLVALGVGITWYDSDGVALSIDEPLENGGIYYAGQTDISGNCMSKDRLEVLVRIESELPPQYFSCEKFRPQPGYKYVVSGWVRENGVTIASTTTKSYTEINKLFAKLLNDLKDLIVNQTPVPSVYVPSPEDRDYDELVPFINISGIDNLTIYNLQPVKEDQNGIFRTVGFSFSFDKEGVTLFSYTTPKNLHALSFESKFYSFPIIGNEDVMTINFTNVENCTEGLCVNANFIHTANLFGITFLPISLDIDQSIDVSSVIKETVDFNTYIPDENYQAIDYANSLLAISYTDRDGVPIPNGASVEFRPKGNIIDGWQRISSDFVIPSDTEFMTISLKSSNKDLNVYFDDIRLHPFDSNMKTFVYDPETQRLQAELDENNYATFYEYDREGGLIRVKKETERGIYTIQETRSGNSKLNKK